tara:strand:+ start:284 stop:1579 length:1296 start_codon:yes stop_codon:yes gene_type:complete
MNANMEDNLTTAMMPSHNVTEKDGRVVIHDLELFVGHIPGFDDDDSGIDVMDEQAIEDIIERTKKHMSAGSNPRLVMLHQTDDNHAPQESLGNIVSISRKDINIRTEDGKSYSGPGIIGDVVMSKSDFEEYISSNRFPRRSAEIWKDGHMSEVALLGRETPARPLRDTRFTKSGEKVMYTRPVTFAQVSPGGSNTFVPTLIDEEEPKKENQMPDDDKMAVEHDGEDMELVTKLKAENEELRNELEQLKMQMNSDEDKEEYEEEDDDEDEMGKARYEEDDDDDDDKEIFSKVQKFKGGQKFVKKYSSLKKSRNLYRRTAQKLGLKLRKEKYSKLLGELEAEGYQIKPNAPQMLEELMSSRDVKSKLKFWRNALRKSPINGRLHLNETRVSGKMEYSAEERKSASERAVARMTKENLADNEFRSVFETELKTG